MLLTFNSFDGQTYTFVSRIERGNNERKQNLKAHHRILQSWCA